MTIKTINAKQIRSINERGITFTDDDGGEGFIDFEVCYQNYLKARLAPEYLIGFQEINSISDEDMLEAIERIKAHKEIGRRNVDGNKHLEADPKSGKPYFVFYEEPAIAIECDVDIEYWKVRDGFQKYGWRTFDMG